MTAQWGDDPRTGEGWFTYHGSNAPRGYWRQGEKRFGVTKHDPARYRRHSLAQLQDLGYARRDISYDEALEPLFTAALWNIREQSELGGRAQLRYEQPVTMHTMLGRKREAKQYAYVMYKEDLANDLKAAGLTDDQVEDVLDAWDAEEDIRVEVQDTPRGRTYNIFEGDGTPVGQEFTDLQLQQVAMQGTEMEEEFLEYLGQREAQEAAAAQYVAELYEQGIDPYAMGYTFDQLVEDLDDVREAIEERQMYVQLDDKAPDVAHLEGEPYTVDLDEVPF